LLFQYVYGCTNVPECDVKRILPACSIVGRSVATAVRIWSLNNARGLVESTYLLFITNILFFYNRYMFRLQSFIMRRGNIKRTVVKTFAIFVNVKEISSLRIIHTICYYFIKSNLRKSGICFVWNLFVLTFVFYSNRPYFGFLLLI
jgi:hypothetical protein